jgi:peptidoglycan/LPS O-acetylase OafA/YrhL
MSRTGERNSAMTAHKVPVTGGTRTYERFQAFDGLRGLGALLILLYHLPEPPQQLGTYIYLLVDMFFLLSGFVLAHVYEHRMREPGAIAGFLRERVIRLHPLLVLAVLPGAISITMLGYGGLDPYPGLTAIAAAVPFPALWKAGLPRFPFPLNLPSWSLFWEIVTNILFAFAAPWLRTRTLAIGVAVLAVATIVAGAFQPLQDGTLAITGIRGLVGFPLGMLLLRVHRSGRVKLPAFIGPLAIPLILLVVLPPVPYALAYETLVRFVLFPLLLLGCASHTVRFPALNTLSGELSYPIYILHVPLLATIKIAAASLGLGYNQWIQSALGLFLIWAIWRFYDAPLRTWLRRRFGWRRPPAARDAPDRPAAASLAGPAPPYRE